jgi:predicted ABC-type ATPase
MKKRLRIFAGPNGSGKSTLKANITSRFDIPFGCFVNADEIEKSLTNAGCLDFTDYGLKLSLAKFLRFAQSSSLSEKIGNENWWLGFSANRNKLFFKETEINSYHAALVAEFIRLDLLRIGATFSMETVLSDARKLDFIATARKKGYRVYLYFVATDDPSINIQRVSERVKTGGHHVATEKVKARYYRTLEILPKVIDLTHRAYLFDNSQTMEFIGEVTDGASFEFENGEMPKWISELLKP